MIVREIYEKLYAKKFYNVDEMDKFLEGYKSLKLILIKIDNPNNPISIKKLNLYVKAFLQRKHFDPDDFTDEFYHTFKEEIILMSTQSPPGRRWGGNTSLLILWGQYYYPDTKTRQRLWIKYPS